MQDASSGKLPNTFLWRLCDTQGFVLGYHRQTQRAMEEVEGILFHAIPR